MLCWNHYDCEPLTNRESISVTHKLKANKTSRGNKLDSFSAVQHFSLKIIAT